MMPVGRMNIKAPIFSGTDLERVTNWIWKMEIYLRASRVPAEEYFYNAVFALTGDADNFIYSLVLKKGSDLTWDEFKAAMIERYDKTAVHADILRQQLERVHFEGPAKMVEYCTSFHMIEQQLLDMDYDDRVRLFIKTLPTHAILHVRLMDRGTKDMDVIYQAAQQWAHIVEDAKAM